MNPRAHLREIIFGTDTPAGRIFDIFLIISVLLSVLAVMLSSVGAIEVKHGSLLRCTEWLFTILFTVEYILRIYCAQKSARYVFSFFGVIDLLAFLPTYISILLPGSHYFMAIRILRVLRVFRVLKLASYIREINQLVAAVKRSGRRILVFLLAVFTLVVMLGAIMYVVEGEESGFTSIPRSIYWAIVTLTTVGYGDISPKTNVGQALAAIVMILGYSIIVVPAGFVSVAISSESRSGKAMKSCNDCDAGSHDEDAGFCKHCGSKLQ